MDTKKLNVLVTGANGQLGCALRAHAKNSTNRFVFTDIADVPGVETVFLDVTNPSAVKLICDSENIDVIINCAAFTNVDGAESSPREANDLNINVPKELAKIASKRKATLIHISTDYIFSGNSTPISEDVTPHPLSVYGTSKLAGEKAITSNSCKYIILRTAWLYSEYGHNFVKTMLRLTSEKEAIKVVYDQVGTPTYAGDLAAFIVSIIDSGKLSNTGIYNYTNLGVTSWYDFAVAIQRIASAGQSTCQNPAGHNATGQNPTGQGVVAGTAGPIAILGAEERAATAFMPNPACHIAPCLSSEYSQKARRPSYSVLDKSLVQKTFGVQIPHWLDSLKQCLKQLGYGN